MVSEKKVILCVDDDPNVLLSLKTQLKLYYKKKFYYETAHDANEAFLIVEHLNNEHKEIILIISDWLLRGMKGDEFLIKIKQTYPKINTVLLTGHAPIEAIENAKKNAGILTCLNKPWSMEDLISMIEMASK